MAHAPWLCLENNVGNVEDELSIGLYIPGNPSYSSNFTIVERDFLAPSQTSDNTFTEGDLALRYYVDTQAPRPAHLVNELQFVSPEGRSLPDRIELDDKTFINTTYNGNGNVFEVHEINFRYGSCVRFPYGQVSRMELDQDEQLYFYGKGTFDDNDESKKHIVQHFIEEQSLLGYCENIADDPTDESSTQYPFCFADPLHSKRTQFCTSSLATQYNVVGQAINERKFENVCNLKHKYCLSIAGDPLFPTVNDILRYPLYSDFDGFTILMSPFNFTVARFLLGPLSFYYQVGGGGDVYNLASSTLENDADKLRSIFGIELLSEAEFDFLAGNHFSDDTNNETLQTAMDFMKAITQKINNTFVNQNTTTHSTWPVLSVHVKDTLQSNVNADFVYPSTSDTNIDIFRDNMVVRSALEDGVIKFTRSVNDQEASYSCNRFLVSGSNFTLFPTFADQTNCITSQSIDNAVVLFGGENVSHSSVVVGSTEQSETPVVFAGSDSIYFTKASVINSSNVSITLTNDKFTYVTAAAQTFTDSDKPIQVTFLFDFDNTSTPTAVIQPLKNQTCDIILTDKDGDQLALDIFDISKYTEVFSNNVLEAEFPLRSLPHHTNYVLFVVLVCGNVLILAKGFLLWFQMAMKPQATIDNTSSSSFKVYNTMFGTSVAFNTKTKEHWNAYNLRRKVVNNRLGQAKTGVPAELEDYLFQTHFKTE